MRIVSWNIYNGGQDGPDAHLRPLPRKQVPRLDSIIAALKARQPDVVTGRARAAALLEAAAELTAPLRTQYLVRRSPVIDTPSLGGFGVAG